jgi:hypothetical protein
MHDNTPLPRVFMTAWFSKAVRKALIAEDELCHAAWQVTVGQAENLGGGVFKKRLNRNAHRAIILTKVGEFWIYEYIFAKKDMENIGKSELRAFRMLAKSYATLNDHQIGMLLAAKDWIEICKGKKS